MRERDRFSPREENLGRNCRFWSQESGCRFPKTEMLGRYSCEGVVDDVCLYLVSRRIPSSLTPNQLEELRRRLPNEPLDIPPGDIDI
ncbi:MAG: hypothetical protein ACD_50C00309G0006 [uncultured bacterium]|nr:MAG: hypothetical protein ACD_50C00309G0006 [uncultured bacterium]OGH13175.1 MAG: hypothetical protein A2687_05320 [Candidatus Levybacteria bacterium RIFCSPHIGHO2_01_FULL_38_26]